jgi:nucleoside-diphosphate-sugar epimerase
MTMHVLVTGGAGYVGSRVVSHLLEAGHRVRVLDKLLYGAESLLAFHGRRRFALLPGDVRDPFVVSDALQGVDAVVHLAAVVGEPACSVDPEQAFAINHGGTKTVLQEAAAAGTPRLVFISTCSNYGALPHSFATETSALDPLSSYARAKVEGERLVLDSTTPPCATVLRLGTICGLGERMRFDLLVNDIAKRSVRGEPIRIYAPDAWRPFLHVLDAARAIATVLEAPEATVNRRVFNVVGENRQKRGLADLARKHFPSVPIAITDDQPDLRDYRVDGSRFATELGFRVEHSVEEAFLETAQAVANGVFGDPDWRGHSAIPLHPERLRP